MLTAPRLDLHGTRVVVTGAAAGSVGGETARILREWGADVVGTTRNGRDGTASLDLTEPSSVRAFAASLDSVDVLVNNAGVHLDLLNRWREPQLLDGFEVHWRTNYLGTMHLTHLLLPKLPETGRVINVVSKLHTRGRNAALFAPAASYSSWDAYGQSKLALIHATSELRRRGTAAVAVHPGEVLTDIATKGLAGHRVIGAVRRALRPLEARVLQTPFEGAQTSVLTATQPIEALYYAKGKPKEPSPETADAAVAARLWDETEAWVRALP